MTACSPSSRPSPERHREALATGRSERSASTPPPSHQSAQRSASWARRPRAWRSPPVESKTAVAPADGSPSGATRGRMETDASKGRSARGARPQGSSWRAARPAQSRTAISRRASARWISRSKATRRPTSRPVTRSARTGPKERLVEIFDFEVHARPARACRRIGEGFEHALGPRPYHDARVPGPHLRPLRTAVRAGQGRREDREDIGAPSKQARKILLTIVLRLVIDHPTSARATALSLAARAGLRPGDRWVRRGRGANRAWPAGRPPRARCLVGARTEPDELHCARNMAPH